MPPVARPGARLLAEQLRLLSSRAATGPGQQQHMPPLLCLRCTFRFTNLTSRRLYLTEKPSSPSASPTSPTSPTSPPSPASSNPTVPDPAQEQSPYELPSTTERRRSPLLKRLSHLADPLQSRALTASQTLNDLTGYTAIERIKAENDAREHAAIQAQQRVRAARARYKTSHDAHAATQREIAALLARKDSWTPADLERFTGLYRVDHAQEADAATAGRELAEAEAEEQGLTAALSNGILRRYHEEQIWSDRIRRASTWGTWGLMGVNVLLFLALQFVAEPWRRKRLVRGVVEEEKAVLDEVRARLDDVVGALASLRTEGGERATGIAAEAVPELGDAVAVKVAVAGDEAADTMTTTSWIEAFHGSPASWRDGLADLFSDRRVELRIRDLSVAVLEAAAVGGAVVGGLVIILLRRN